MAASPIELKLPPGVEIKAPVSAEFAQILTPEALALVAKLHRQFQPRRRELLAARVERAKRLDAGERPDFLPQTKAVREGDWKIAPIPRALECRRVEITGPVEAKMVINAFNSGADSYMTDFEDSNSPGWFNQVQGQINLKAAIRRELDGRIGRQAIPPQRPDRDPAGQAARLASGREARAGGRRAGLGRTVRLRTLPLSQRQGAGEPGRGTFLLPAQAGEPPRGAGSGTTCSCWRRRRSACRRARSRRPS